MSSLDEHLIDLLSTASAELPEVTSRRMFSCRAFFANRNIYALVWDNRLCVKLTDPELMKQALALEGAGTWSPTGDKRGMGHWVMLPEELHDDLDGLTPWVERAHRLAMLRPPKPPARKKRAAKAKPKRRSAK
jgi:TfoX/Sxy family transcriptional regulator of competence genes